MYKEIIDGLNGMDAAGIIKIVLSKAAADIQKAAIRPVVLKNEKKWQIEKIINNQAFHLNIEHNDLSGRFLELLEEYRFRNVNFILNGGTVSYTVTKKNKVFKSESKTAVNTNAVLSHDKKKNYIINEGMPVEPLVDLGVFDKNYRVIKSRRDKFKQINHFVEIIADGFKDYKENSELSIIDFGCGKSYLTFVLYYYFTEIKKIRVNITGYDIKTEVIARCKKAAEKYGYTGISFIAGDISKIEAQSGKVDMIITLHACDTATDHALHYAIINNVKHIFSVPCCQQEINAQISNKGGF